MFHALSQHHRVRVLIMAVATLLMAFASTVAMSPSAHAAAQADNCLYLIPSTNGGGAGTLKISTNLKNWPQADCDNVGYVNSGKVFYYWCKARNVYGNEWMYGRIAGTSTEGWTSMANLSTYDSSGIAWC
ncbi:hypothetical protein [Streptomyces europaeiscabiei]|uniref:hypothetical protein n=1 Tax=Streptomyces europaeiscabiei TaxID=146819 RepID=UPI002E0EEC0A|nr:hypothetical protein OHB30_34380 [Streptomyces europaeiscabiei]